MEQKENTFAAQKKRRKTRRIIKACLGILLAVLLLLGGLAAYRVLKIKNKGENAQVSTVSYTAQRVTRGSVTTTLSSSGTLTPKETETLYAGVDGLAENVFVQAGDRVQAGDILMTLAPYEDDNLVQELEAAEESLRTTPRLSNSLYLRSGVKGVVKDSKLFAGADVAAIMEEYGYVCLISTDSLMQTEVETDILSLYDTVTLTTEAGKILTGTVRRYEKGVANILIDDITQPVGAVVTVLNADGREAGTGTLALVSYEKVTGVDGLIASVSVSDGSSVGRNSTLAVFKAYPTSANYEQKREEYQDLLKEYEEAVCVTAPFSGKVLAVSIEPEGEVLAGDMLITLQSDGGYTVTLSLDEEDVLTVAAGQKVKVTLDALAGTYEGTISSLSYVNSGSNNARYQAVVSAGNIEGALPGMSATCTIVLSESGEGLLVPAEAVETINGKTVVYLAPENAAFGTVYGEAETDLTALTAVEVEILASDGSYLLVAGELSEGDMILVKERTTSAEYEAEDTAGFFNSFRQNGGFGGTMGGGEMPSMPNMGGNDWNSRQNYDRSDRKQNSGNRGGGND